MTDRFMENLTSPNSRIDSDSPLSSAADATSSPSRAAYTPPVLERLGAWRALTLQQSVPIFP